MAEWSTGVEIVDYTLNLKPPEAYCLWSIQLPLPPSQNQLWIPVATRGRSRFVTSAEYKKWRTCIQLSEWNEAPIFTFPLGIVLTTKPGQEFPESSDIDNFFKAPIDALKRHFIIADDNCKFIHHVSNTLGNAEDFTGQGMIQVELYPAWLWTGRLPDQTGELFQGSE